MLLLRHAARSDARPSYRTARGVPQEQHDALCAITANAARCRGAQLLPLQLRRGSYIASLLPEYTFSRAQAGAKNSLPELSSPSFLAWPTRSVQSAPLDSSARREALDTPLIGAVVCRSRNARAAPNHSLACSPAIARSPPGERANEAATELDGRLHETPSA